MNWKKRCFLDEKWKKFCWKFENGFKKQKKKQDSLQRCVWKQTIFLFFCFFYFLQGLIFWMLPKVARRNQQNSIVVFMSRESREAYWFCINGKTLSSTKMCIFQWAILDVARDEIDWNTSCVACFASRENGSGHFPHAQCIPRIFTNSHIWVSPGLAAWYWRDVSSHRGTARGADEARLRVHCES